MKIPLLKNILRKEIIMTKSNCQKSCKVTSSKVASVASKVLRDGRTSAASKTVAASALSQKPSTGKK